MTKNNKRSLTCFIYRLELRTNDISVTRIHCKSLFPKLLCMVKRWTQGPRKIDNWGGGAHIHIFVLCIINFFWNRLVLRSVNTNIWICAPPIIDLPRPQVERTLQTTLKTLNQCWKRIDCFPFLKTTLRIAALSTSWTISQCHTYVEKTLRFDDDDVNGYSRTSNSAVAGLSGALTNLLVFYTLVIKVFSLMIYFCRDLIL